MRYNTDSGGRLCQYSLSTAYGNAANAFANTSDAPRNALHYDTPEISVTESTPGQGINASQLQALSAPLVITQQLEFPANRKRMALLSGYMKVTELQPGMRLRLANVQDHYGLTSRAELPAGIKIALVIDGLARIRYGHERVELGPGGPSSGLVAVLPSKTQFQRQGKPGSREQTLTLTLTPQWLARHGFEHLLMSADGVAPALWQWQPSSHLQEQAANLFCSATDHDGPFYQMAFTGFALSFASEALSHITAEKEPSFVTLPGNAGIPDAQLTRLMNLIDSGQARRATQAELARELGMSLSNLQRRFRASFGEALGHYLRRHYLDAAREALIRERISVEAAADLAGYTSATNFATAFRREFGVAPSDCRSPLTKE